MPSHNFEPTDDIDDLIPEEARGTFREAEWRAQLYALYDVPQFDKLFLRLRLYNLELRAGADQDDMRVDISVPRQATRSSRTLSQGSAICETLQFAGVRIGMTVTFAVISLKDGDHRTICSGIWSAKKCSEDVIIDLLQEGSGLTCGDLRLNLVAMQARDFGLFLDGGLFPMTQEPVSSPVINIFDTLCSPSPDTISDALHRLASATPADTERHVFDIGNGQLLKRGSRVLAREAVAMEFVRLHTSIPVPQVHAFFECDGVGHIVMQKVRGIALSSILGTLSSEQRLDIHRQLSQMILELRGLPCQSALGGWPSGPYNNIDFRDPEPAGPFQSIEHFWLYWVQKRRLDPCPPPAALSSSSRFVLSHGDLVPKNILVEGSTIVAVLDWETLGTYPDSWEAMIVATQLNYPPDVRSELPGWPHTDGGALCSIVHSLLYPLPF